MRPCLRKGKRKKRNVFIHIFRVHGILSGVWVWVFTLMGSTGVGCVEGVLCGGGWAAGRRMELACGSCPRLQAQDLVLTGGGNFCAHSEQARC